MLSARVVFAFLFVVAACGDDGGGSTIDAAVGADAAVDALPGGCDYMEQRDATNDNVSSSSGMPEATALDLATALTICGAFEHTHHDGDITVDIDAYTFSLVSPADVLVRIHGTGAEAIELVGVDIYGGPTASMLVGAVTFYGDHGVTSVRLQAGTYELIPFALASAPLTATVPYTLALAIDTPATRCMDLTSGGYAEANDGGSNTGNDVVAFPQGAPPALTAGADAPEPSGLSLAPATSSRIAGSAADVSAADKYEDKDTFAFATAAGTNELTVRLAWTGAANLDFFLFEAGTPAPVLRAIGTAAGAETATFSVKPGTDYWFLVGALAGGSGLPASYSATLCGAAYSP